ncbi:MAG: hypothetical protein KGR69_09405 [Verrucomicrobia bacterium]|jgi:hypothetical protein|nr:hypothetical protein [Verrucomicrobiota bacterium]
MDRKTKYKAGCGLLAVFGAGFLCGAVALFLFLVRIIPLSEGWRDEESKEFVTDHLAGQLDLTDGQLEQVRPLIHAALDERYERRKAYVKEDIALTGQAMSEILPFLTETQQEKAKKVFQRWKKGKERFTGTLE